MGSLAISDIGRIWMDDMQCNGNETKITECHFRGWGKSDCDATEAAGVVCLPAKTNPTDTSTSSMDELHRQRLNQNLNIDIRLAGGRNEREGRVEVKTTPKSPSKMQILFVDSC